MTPAQATAYLDQKSAEFAAQFTPQLPSAEQIQDARDAEQLLARLTCDPVWVRKFTEGERHTRAEYERLTAMITDGRDQTGSAVIGDVEVVEEGGVRRADLLGVITDLDRIGVPTEGIIRTLNADFSPEDIEWAETELNRALATKEWTDGLLRGDPTCRHEFTAWCAVIAAGKAA
jgi:hypothetical protein